MDKTTNTRQSRVRAGRHADSSSETEDEAPLPESRRRRRHGRPPTTEKEWYSKVEAAGYLGVSEITVTRYLARGILHAQRLPTPGSALGAVPESGPKGYDYGRLRIHRNELDRYLDSIDRHNATATVPAARRGDSLRSDTEQSEILSSVIDGLDGEVMTREEAALQLGVSWRTIKRYIESGRLRLAGYFRCPDSYTRAHVYRAEVEGLLDQRDKPDERIERFDRGSDP